MKNWEAYEDYIREHGTRVMAIKKAKRQIARKYYVLNVYFFQQENVIKREVIGFIKNIKKTKLKSQKQPKQFQKAWMININGQLKMKLEN